MFGTSSLFGRIIGKIFGKGTAKAGASTATHVISDQVFTSLAGGATHTTINVTNHMVETGAWAAIKRWAARIGLVSTGTAVGVAGKMGYDALPASPTTPPPPPTAANLLGDFGNGVTNPVNNNPFLKAVGIGLAGVGLVALFMTSTAGAIIAGAGALMGLTWLAGGFDQAPQQPAGAPVAGAPGVNAPAPGAPQQQQQPAAPATAMSNAASQIGNILRESQVQGGAQTFEPVAQASRPTSTKSESPSPLSPA